ncbi:MAG TPA: threonine/serine dehydratase [Spirillospora sp.]|nr:threonine/serine dehydratase [Spirillospora sp.]
MTADHLTTLADIQAALPLVRANLHRTPMVASTSLSQMTGVDLRFKAELFQKTGSFKPRGILHKINSLSDEEKRRGVITISAGNAAQAVAFAAQKLDIPATVVMPENAVQSKVEATHGYGARVVLHGTVKDLFPRMQEIQRQEGQVFIHPFDDLHVIAGHGTLGLEILDDEPAPDYVFVGVGGGGLISGVAAALRLSNPTVKVIGVEPEGAPGMTRSLADGQPHHLERVDTIADGLAAPFAGEHCLRHVQAFVDQVVLVSDSEIIAAMRLILERCKLVVEPAAAASLAALLFKKVALPANVKVVCVLSGGNVDMNLFKRIF